MSIIITGLKMPTERECFNLTIKYNGTVLDTETGIQVAEAHELPPHGDLIERDELFKKCEFACTDDDEDVRVVRYSVIESAPTIIEAEEDET